MQKLEKQVRNFVGVVSRKQNSIIESIEQIKEKQNKKRIYSMSQKFVFATRTFIKIIDP